MQNVLMGKSLGKEDTMLLSFLSATTEANGVKNQTEPIENQLLNELTTVESQQSLRGVLTKDQQLLV